MNIEFRKPIEKDSRDISTWKYEGIYSFYDNDKTEMKQQWASNIHKEDDIFAMYNENNELIGNCSFDYDEEDKKYMVGVQMRPSLTGKGMGTEVISSIIEFGKKTYSFDELYLLVAKFNERAIKIYKRLGFEVTEEFTWFVNGEEKEFYEMKKAW